MIKINQHQIISISLFKYYFYSIFVENYYHIYVINHAWIRIEFRSKD